MIKRLEVTLDKASPDINDIYAFTAILSPLGVFNTSLIEFLGFHLKIWEVWWEIVYFLEPSALKKRCRVVRLHVLNCEGGEDVSDVSWQ